MKPKRKARMNLFSDLRLAGRAEPVAGGWQVAAPLLVVLIIAVCFAWRWFDFRRSSARVRAQIAQVNRQLAQIAADALEQAAAEKRAPAVDRTAGAAKTQEDVELDDTWISLLWKVSAFSTPDVALNKLSLTREKPTVSDGPSVRVLVLEGQAKSIHSIESWLEGLTRHIPGFAFSVEKQESSGAEQGGAQGSASDYPVLFKIQARAAS